MFLLLRLRGRFPVMVSLDLVFWKIVVSEGSWLGILLYTSALQDLLRKLCHIYRTNHIYDGIDNELNIHPSCI